MFFLLTVGVASLDHEPLDDAVVSLTGPRQPGKTTLVRACFPEHDYTNLENPELARHIAMGPMEVKDPLCTPATIKNSCPIRQNNAAIAWKSASMDWPKRHGKGQYLDPADLGIFAAATLHGLTVVSADIEVHGPRSCPGGIVSMVKGRAKKGP